MTTSKHYDAIVIGSGQGGNPLSMALARANLRTALIERSHVGGTCINEGCTPTKTMVASGRVAYLARRAADYGVHTGPISIDMKKVRQRKRDIVDSFRGGGEKRIQNTQDLDFISGEASFTDPKTLIVKSPDGKSRSVSATRIFINVGARSSRPKLDGLESVDGLDNISIMELDTVPEHLLVLGGGYIGLEFGQLFRRLGSKVTIVQSGKQLLAREDSDVAAAVLEILEEDGIHILLNARAEKVARHGSRIQLKIRREDKMISLEGSHLLVATGRVPNSDTLN